MTCMQCGQACYLAGCEGGDSRGGSSVCMCVCVCVCVCVCISGGCNPKFLLGMPLKLLNL